MSPVFFEKNRVSRVYTGGKLFDSLFGDGSEDGFFPEEWIASAVEAVNREPKREREGVSRVLPGGEYFDELIERDRYGMLGPSGKMRILVKFLDSAVRLPAQAHPDRAFSEKYFNSEYGKTESWIVLGVREDAKIFFGFKDGVGEDSFRQAIADSETDKDAMERLMCSITPKVGDVYIVPARTVHAIGKGCLILEIQEPTDFTIQPERWCADYKLSDKEMYLGLTPDEAIGCFDFGRAPDTKIVPRVEFERDGVKKERLIDESITPCFSVNRIELTGGSYTPDVKDSFAVYIVTEGCGTITGAGYERALRRGDYFFMPFSEMGEYKILGNLKIVECY